METSNIYKKIALVQADLKPIIKDKNNPHFKNAYFDINDLIAAIKPITIKHGLVWMQPLDIVDGKNVIKNVITDLETGDQEISTALLPEITDPQKFVAAVTYYKRITGAALWLVEGEQEDDGNTAARKTVEIDPKPAIAKLRAVETIEELQSVYAKLTQDERSSQAVADVKDEMKAKLTEQTIDVSQ